MVLKGFRQFILRGNVVDLSVGVIIGAAFNSVVSSFVKDVITPIIGIFGQVPDFSQLSFTVNESKFNVGDLINAIISFLISAIVLYFFIVLPMNALMGMKRSKVPSPDPTTKKCPECLSEIPKDAIRCAFCTVKISSSSATSVSRGSK